MRTAAEVLTETLKKSGVKFVFGIPSIHNIPVYDALYQGTGYSTHPVPSGNDGLSYG